MNQVTITRDATPAEQAAIEAAKAELAKAGLELIGTRPKDR